MLDNLYNLHLEEKDKQDDVVEITSELLIGFCTKLMLYCDIKNGLHPNLIKNELLISLKFENDDVKPYSVFYPEWQKVVKL